MHSVVSRLRLLLLRSISLVALAAPLSSPAWAGGKQVIEQVIVTGARVSEIGTADSANVGTVTQEQLRARTAYRPGELLESTPGLIVSQHSGEGKANQFYVRGFNLDHGTDLRTSVDGMLVNQRSHSHGQGWTDVNFLIPELAVGLEYRKGPYYADQGDFSSAGSVQINYADSLLAGIADLGWGENGYRRALLADSPPLGDGRLLYALEYFHNNGPFENPDDYRKVNGVLRYSRGDKANGFNITAMGYSAQWNATDQIAQRAIDTGLIKNRFDAIDPTDGGDAHRYSLSGAWRRTTDAATTKVNGYVIDWRLNLFSNFTYFLDDPVNGDQFTQPDHRTITGLNASHAWRMRWAGIDSQNTIGVQLQNDNISNGLLSTRARQTIATIRTDHIVEGSVGIFAENATQWTEWFRSVVGLRADSYRFEVDSDRPENSGRVTDSIVNPKLSVVFGPWAQTEYYVNLGGGFHSNDARGTTIRMDPKTNEAVDRVTPLVRSRGYELGVRTAFIPGLQTSLSIFELDFDSELLFVGDAGTTEAGRPSRRVGMEFANYYRYGDWLTVDADIAFARARFRDDDPAGSRIAGSVEGVASFALAIDNLGPYFGALQWRYFGPRPLVEDDSVRSKSTAVFNGRIGYKLNPNITMQVEGFNLTDRKASAIDYYYASRLPGEAASGVEDIHFHPIESRSFRLSLSASF